jgi:hypothetical protein
VDMLNDAGISSPGGGAWSPCAVWSILRNEIYAGTMVWNKTSSKMKAPTHPNPEGEWIKSDQAFDPIVSKELFFLVQGIIRGRQQERIRRYSAEDMMSRLKQLFDRYGVVSTNLISGNSDMVSSATYISRFRSVDLAFQGMFRDIVDQKRSQIIESLKASSMNIEQYDGFIVIDDLFSVNIQPCVPMPKGYESVWIFHPDDRTEVDLTIGVPLSCPKKFEVLGYLAFPRMLCKGKLGIHTATQEKVDLFAYPLDLLIERLRNRRQT